MNRYVFYHAPSCADGYGSCWSAWKRFGDDATYLPVCYGQDPPVEVATQNGDELYILDFSYEYEILAQLAHCWKQVVIIDHHATAERHVKRFGEQFPTATAIWQADKSGAVLTWEHLHGTPVPRLLEYVQDRDLWRWKLPDSKAISACIASRPWTFEEWDQMEDDLRNCCGTMVAEGRAILRYQAQLVERHVQAAVAYQFDTKGREDYDYYEVPTVNATCLQSEIGHALCEAHPDAPFSASYYDRADGKRCFSLRSIGDFHCGEYAQRLGGGGHKGAAGFERERRDV